MRTSTVACGNEIILKTDKPRVKLCATVKAVIVFTTFSRPVTKNNKPKIKRM